MKYGILHIPTAKFIDMAEECAYHLYSEDIEEVEQYFKEMILYCTHIIEGSYCLWDSSLPLPSNGRIPRDCRIFNEHEFEIVEFPNV